MRKIMTIVTVAVMVLVGLSSAPATAEDDTGSASVSSVPRVKLGQTRTTTQQTPYPLSTVYRLPVLTGSTAANRARVTTLAKKALASERTRVGRWRSSCAPAPHRATIDATRSSLAVLQGRYVSVATVFVADAGCGGVDDQYVRSFTLDLRTGKTVGAERFLAVTAQPTRLAIVSALKRKGCFAGVSSLESLPRPTAWNVSKDGVRVWYRKYAVAEGACGAVTVLLPWPERATAAQLRGERTSRIYVKDLVWHSEEGYYTGQILVLTVQGRRVAVLNGYLASEAFCGVGVRAGSSATIFSVPEATRTKLKLGGTYRAPRISLPAGWRQPTATERSRLASDGTPLDAVEFCS